jgi:SAM-dependent methyltransferase
MNNNLLCPICSAPSSLLDVVDFNKSCEELRGMFIGLSGISIYYARCGNCGFCFAPEIAGWKFEEFEDKIYNKEYVQFDPDYIESRPRSNANHLISTFSGKANSFRHLDYGGGDGLLSKILKESSWQSISYDSFVNKDICIAKLGKFDLITAYEVFEHVPDPIQLMSDLRSLLSPNGIILFSTLLSDGNININQRLGWWYASPRNGHISLFSRKSLEIIAKNNAFNFGSFSAGYHVFFTDIPSWASHLIPYLIAGRPVSM